MKVKHPKEECNKQQEQFLAGCPPEHRRLHELIFTYGNITYRYHKDARTVNPTEEDYKEWLEGLPENVRKGMEAMGFEGCKTVLSFTRYVMEKNDIGLEEYVQLHMGAEEYAEYKSMLNKAKD